MSGPGEADPEWGSQAQENTFRWATVTAVGPLRIRLDGDTASIPRTPDSLVERALAVGSRVWVQLFGRRVIILGSVGDAGVPTSAALFSARYLATTWLHTSSGAYVLVPFNGQDSNEIPWNAVTNVFDVQVAGLYLLATGVQWAAHATGSRYLRILKNGAQILRAGPMGPSSVILQNLATCLLRCSVGDTVGVGAYHNNGASLNVLGDVNHGTYVHLAKVG